MLAPRPVFWVVYWNGSWVGHRWCEKRPVGRGDHNSHGCPNDTGLVFWGQDFFLKFQMAEIVFLCHWCILYTNTIHPPISSTKSQPVPPCTNLFFVQPYLGIQKHIHSGPWLCSEMMLPCILGLGCNFVEAPFVWAGFWFCNGSRVQTHFVENTGCWFVLLVLRRCGSPYTKSGSHYKIRTPLQNQDPEPFFESQQQDQKSPNWVSTKWSSITQAQKFITFRLLFSNQVPDFVEQFRVPAWWSGALSDGLWFKKKGVATWFCRELARSEFCWNLIS